MTLPAQRLHSLDALRGFDMFFIIGGAELVKAVCRLFPSEVSTFLSGQMEHVDWHGFAFYDMIFPLFLFIAGVSFPYSLEASRGKGATTGTIVWSVFKRALKLVVLGWIFNGLLAWDFENMRYVSVLGRIGVAWALGALVYLFGGVRWSAGVGGAILLGYYLLCAFVPSPLMPSGGSPFSVEGSIVAWVDVHYLPGRCLEATHDPLGLLSTLPAVATALLGILTGTFLRKGAMDCRKRLFLMVGTSFSLVAIGLLWDPFFSINKKLWSSSYVCFAGGLSLLLLSLFYGIIDVLRWRKWSFFFTVIGLNSITIYLVQKIVKFTAANKFIFGGTVALFPEQVQPVVSSLGYLVVVWVFLWFLYKRGIFLKV